MTVRAISDGVPANLHAFGGLVGCLSSCSPICLAVAILGRPVYCAAHNFRVPAPRSRGSAGLAMLYRLHEIQRRVLDPVAQLAGAGARLLCDPAGPLAYVPAARLVGASQALLHRVARRYDKPAFAIDRIEVRGRVERWVERWGVAAAEEMLQANNEESTITVRPYAVSRDVLDTMLVGDGVDTYPVPLVPDSIRLAAGVALTS